MSQVRNPLELLQEFVLTKKEINESNDNFLFGKYTWPKNFETNCFITQKQSNDMQFYTLGSLIYFAQNKHLPHPVYVQQADCSEESFRGQIGPRGTRLPGGPTSRGRLTMIGPRGTRAIFFIANIAPIRRPDRKKILDYLTGATDISTLTIISASKIKTIPKKNQNGSTKSTISKKLHKTSQNRKNKNNYRIF